jgi:hypothetical protein
MITQIEIDGFKTLKNTRQDDKALIAYTLNMLQNYLDGELLEEAR